MSEDGDAAGSAGGGKKPHLEDSAGESDDASSEQLDPKANAYLKEMQKYSERLCKDDSGHVRPLVK